MTDKAYEELCSLLEKEIKIISYSPKKAKPILIDGSEIPRTVADVVGDVLETVKRNPAPYNSLFVLSVTGSRKAIKNLILKYIEEENLVESKPTIEVPPYFMNRVLLQDITSSPIKYVVTTDDYRVLPISGDSYKSVMGLKDADAAKMAIKVVPKYLPRNPDKLIESEEGKDAPDILNIYIEPSWAQIVRDESLMISSKPPKLFSKLINSIFPLPEERDYFLDWLHESLFNRAYVYLVLCGAPGVGKNRLKLLMRALHGHANTVDGKKSTLTERFNSQLGESTLAWFDELHYDMEMENVMKEIQNDTISIEKKGIDATKSTRLFASCVISNNKPRDNYIAFDARKFSPLLLNTKRLEESMTPEEIDMLSKKIENEDSPDFDPVFLAYIVTWLKKRGTTGKWPTLEYKGPMFYRLTHTSMAMWQKKAVTLVATLDPLKYSRIVYDEKLGFKWSSLEAHSMKKNGDKSLKFPAYSTVKHLFDVFVDAAGRKPFETSDVENDVFDDFWVKVKSAISILNKEGGLNTLTTGGMPENEEQRSSRTEEPKGTQREKSSEDSKRTAAQNLRLEERRKIFNKLVGKDQLDRFKKNTQRSGESLKDKKEDSRKSGAGKRGQVKKDEEAVFEFKRSAGLLPRNRRRATVRDRRRLTGKKK